MLTVPPEYAGVDFLRRPEPEAPRLIDPKLQHAMARLKTDTTLFPLYQHIARMYDDLARACIVAGGDPVHAGRAQTYLELRDDIDNAAAHERAAYDAPGGSGRDTETTRSGWNGANTYV